MKVIPASINSLQTLHAKDTDHRNGFDSRSENNELRASNDTVAQIMTIFLHFLFGAIAPIVVITLQSIESTAKTGDALRYAFTIVPTYCVGHGLIAGATAESLSSLRDGYIGSETLKGEETLPELSSDAYALVNVGGDILMMLVIAAFCTLVLFLVEADIFQCCSRCSIFSQPPPRLV